ncbi:HAD family phosphatase [Clostridiaceae bacterium M8S5]|nr:HAD family phosphatase [Clostridiaceae bacterium M8S5]
MKLVIFDMDGVIIDSEHIYSKLDEEIYKELGINVEKAQRESFVGKTSLDVWSDLHKRHSLHDRITVNELILKQRKKYLEGLEKNGVKMVDGILDWMKYFKDNDITMIIASSSPESVISYVIDKFGLDKYIDGFINGDEVENGKPDPEIFLRAADKFGCGYEECLVIEDSSNGVKAAKMAGMKCIGYKNVNSGNQDLSSADYIFSEFNSENLAKII